jgi:uncharacterized protein (TIGR00269 family)
LLPEVAEGLVRKVKPLWQVSEMETAAYGFLKGIDYVTEECPLSFDATSLIYKEALSMIEEKMPGTRRRFYQGFLHQDRDDPGKSGVLGRGDEKPPGKCISCNAPTYTETCGYCRLKERFTKAQGRS